MADKGKTDLMVREWKVPVPPAVKKKWLEAKLRELRLTVDREKQNLEQKKIEVLNLEGKIEMMELEFSEVEKELRAIEV